MGNKAVFVGSVRGVDLRLDAHWLLIAILLTWTLSAGYLPELGPGTGPMTVAAAAAGGVIGLVACVALHGLAHILAAQAHRQEVRAITLSVFGGVAEMAREPPDPRTEIRVAVAGPLVSFALAAIAFGLWRAADGLGADALVLAALRSLCLANLVLGAVNLLPAFPLDGGRLMRAFLWHRGGDWVDATAKTTTVSAWTAAGLIALGLWGLVLGGFSGGGAAALWLALLGYCLVAAAPGHAEGPTALAGRNVAEVMRPDPICVAPSMALGAVVDRVMLRHGLSFLPVVEGGRLLGTLDLRCVRGIDRDLWPTTQVGDIFIPLADAGVVASDAPASPVFERMKHGGPRKLAVVRGGHLVGVVTLADLVIRVKPHAAPQGLARG